uniref:Uncharacterized protein n=1 Tax=Xylaria arbuscula TaxID=114810 RepID=A0A9W8N6C2_9PEZI
MPPPEQQLYEPSSRTATSDHDPAMSYHKTPEEGLPDNAPPIAITSAPNSPELDTITTNTTTTTTDQDGQNGTKGGSGNASGLDVTSQPLEPILQAQDAADNNHPHEPDSAAEAMESSVATLKPSRPQFLTINTTPYVDPTPPTPTSSQPPVENELGPQVQGTKLGFFADTVRCRL